jgi:hypothetical protein
MIMETISYLRRGRKLRATGAVIERDQSTRMTKVKPAREDWGMVWLDEVEIEAGREKPPTRPREKKDAPQPKPKREKKPKPEALPRWKQLVAVVRDAETDSRMFPNLTVNLVSELATELEAAHAKLAELLPLND